jgi:hypothetical protein
MNDWAKMLTTMIVWGAVAGIIISTQHAANDLNALAFILVIGASLSTAAVWRGSQSNHAPELRDQVKAKRDRHMTRLVDRLDEDEVYQLEELLAARRDEPYIEGRQ